MQLNRNAGRKLVAACGLSVILGVPVFAHAVDREEGGYCGNDPTTPSVVYSFLKEFNYEQYYWAHPSQFTTNNNNRVDEMDFAYYCGHGAPWYIGTYSGGVNLRTAGASSHIGYGNRDLEFIVFHSCKVVPSPREYPTSWWQHWVSESDDIFDGLHQAIGFRTNAAISSAPGIANYFARRVRAGYTIWPSWFAAINARGISGRKDLDMGSVVMHPSTEWDSYASFAPDPPQSHTNLRIWYQY